MLWIPLSYWSRFSGKDEIGLRSGSVNVTSGAWIPELMCNLNQGSVKRDEKLP